MIPILLALAILAADPAPAQPAPPPASSAPSTPPDPAIAEVTAKVDDMLGAFKGKPLLDLVRRLGPIDSTRPASDGQVVYWRARTDSGTKCGMNPATGAFSCKPDWGKECLLAVAVDVPGNVVAWKLTGEVDACRKFLNPPPPAVG